MQGTFVVPLDWYYFQFPGVRLLPNGFGLLSGRFAANALALYSTMHGKSADDILKGPQSATPEQQPTEQPYTAPNATAEPPTGTTEFEYPSMSFTVNPATGQLEPTDGLPPEFFDPFF